MTKILVLSNMYPPHHHGGYELSCRDVVDRLRTRGHDVTILTTTIRVPGVADGSDERAAGIHRELRFYWEDHVLLSPSLPRRIEIERENQRILAATIADVQPDVVSAWNMGAMSLGLLTAVCERAIPLALNVCDEWPVYGPQIDPWTRTFFRHPIRARAARLVTGLPTFMADLAERATFLFVSEAIRRRVEERSAWHPRSATVVYSGIDRRDFPPAERTGSDRPWGWRLLHVGRLDERKGIHFAVEAVAEMHKETTLEILGRGDAAYEDRLRRTASELGLGDRVRFGIVPRSELRHRYHAADAVVFPTVWAEPFGLVPVEAMACGTPVVATGTGGSAEFLLHGVNCLVVPPEDPQAIRDAVATLAVDEALRRRLIAGGFRTAEALDVDRLADVLESWHVAVANRFAGGRPEDRPPVAEEILAGGPKALR